MAELDFSANAHFVSPHPELPRLRVGVIVHDRHLPRFARQVLEDLRACQFVDVACVVNESDPVTGATAFSRSADASISMQAYLRHVDSRYRLEPDPLELVDCEKLLENLPGASCECARNGHAGNEPHVDVYLCLASRGAAKRPLHPAKYGVWALEFGTDARRDQSPPAMLEVMREMRVSTIGLERLDAGHEGELIQRIALSTTPAPSLSGNQFNVYWAAPHLVIQALYGLHSHGDVPHLERPAEEPRPPASTGNLAMAKWMGPLVVRKTLRRFTARSKPEVRWRLGVRRSSTPLYRTPTAEAVREFSWIEPPAGHFWADPFLHQHAGKTWLFYEDYSYATNRGTLACGWLDERGGLNDTRTILDKPYHLSYPNVFAHDGAIWMIPESEQSRRVELYRATSFPDRWTLERTLLDLRGVDATPFQHDGSWWMFISPMITAGSFPMTLLFRAPALTGPWELHPASPISTDVRSARCGGQVVQDGNRLLRPSQNCGPSYGYSLLFNEIVKLDARDYVERNTATLLPEWLEGSGADGLHTYNRAGEWETIDSQAPPAAVGATARA